MNRHTESRARMIPSPQKALQSSPVRTIIGPGTIEQLGAEAAAAWAKRALLVTDSGILRAGHVDRAIGSLERAGVRVAIFSGVAENPTTAHVAAGVAAARDADIDFLIGLGGGSAMDCAKGVNFILTGGGRMQDYWGVGKATCPMLPMIAIPTTAGTGSEAQSFALITDPDTHEKMACGDRKALCICAILDSDLTRTMPRHVAAATGLDAVSHAVETSASLRRTEQSRAASRVAWNHLEPHLEPALRDAADDASRAAMLLGAHLAGIAIEQSMLGAAHACANPLTARYGTPHGVAVGLMLPHVVRFNAEGADENPYADLCDDAEALATRLFEMLKSADQPMRLRDLGVTEAALPDLAQMAASQWTARFNPRPVGVAELTAIYQAAW